MDASVRIILGICRSSDLIPWGYCRDILEHVRDMLGSLLTIPNIIPKPQQHQGFKIGKTSMIPRDIVAFLNRRSHVRVMPGSPPIFPVLYDVPPSPISCR